MLAVIPLIALIAIVIVLLPDSKPETPKVDNRPVATTAPVSTPNVNDLLVIINEERLKAGVKPLTIDDRLNSSAQQKADQMALTGEYGHVDSKGKHGYEYITVECIYKSENLNAGMLTRNYRQTVDSWLNSPAHKQAMLSDEYEITGIAIKGDYVVQHFCNTQ